MRDEFVLPDREALGRCEILEGGRGIRLQGRVLWVFPAYRLTRHGGTLQAADVLLPFRPIRVRGVSWRPPDLTHLHPDLVRKCFDDRRDYHQRLTYSGHIKEHPSDRAFTEQEVAEAASSIVAESFEMFSKSERARDCVWARVGTPGLSEQYSYLGAFGRLGSIAMRARLATYLGSDSEAERELNRISHLVEYDDPAGTSIFLRGIKEEIALEVSKSPESNVLSCLEGPSELQGDAPPSPPIAGIVDVAGDATVADKLELPVKPPARSFTQIGSSWEVIFDDLGRFTVKDSLGARYVDWLLHHPNNPISAFDLGVLIQPEKGHSRAPNSIQAMSDPESTRDNLRTLEKLRAERDRANEIADYGRCEQIEAEIEALVKFVENPREAADTGQRARMNVQKAIKAFRAYLKRSPSPLPEFGAHLEKFISTGYRCSYQSDGAPKPCFVMAFLAAAHRKGQGQAQP